MGANSASSNEANAKSGIKGTADEMERASGILAEEGVVTHDASGGNSRAYTRVIKLGDVVMRFYIDHRNGTGTLKIRRNSDENSSNRR